jgi:hypothetical protein
MNWLTITTWGRLLERVHVDLWPDQIIVKFVRLNPDEGIAVLIDTTHNQAHLGTTPLDVAQQLALQHQYELVIPEKPDETFVGRIERLLRLRHPIKSD